MTFPSDKEINPDLSQARQETSFELNVEPAQQRVSSGISGLDIILQGGFIKRGIYIIMGEPGSGKTILANQTCFNHVAQGERAIYITLLAETHSRMLANLRTLAFFNPNFVADTLTYISGYTTLQRDGLKGLTDLIRKELRQHRQTLLIIDGLTTADAVSTSPLEFKEFIDQLHNYTELNNCTTLLLSHRTGADFDVYRPEYTMVDGIIELKQYSQEERTVRELFIPKLRGTSYLTGKHSFEINSSGVTVYPRLEAVLTRPTAEPADSNKRLSVGVAGLNDMLGGDGVKARTITLLLGTPGSGKSVLGLHFLNAGAENAEPGLLFGFHESPTQTLNIAKELGLQNFEKHVQDGLIHLLWQPPLEELLDVLAARLLEAVRTHKIRRLVIDSFHGFNQTMYPQRLTRFFTALSNELRALGVTTFLILEIIQITSPTVQIPATPVSTIFDNAILLRVVEFRSQTSHLISIIKLRASNYDHSVRQVQISSQTGLQVLGPFNGVENILTGTAHATGQFEAANTGANLSNNPSLVDEPPLTSQYRQAATENSIPGAADEEASDDADSQTV